MKINFRNYHANISFTDLLFNLLLGFIALFFLSYIQINLESSKANITTQAEFIITLTWDWDSCDDVDLWVEDPIGNVIYFGKVESGLTHLDRDDLGCDKDTIMVDGQEIQYQFNQEIVTIRGIIPGEWIVNVHMYHRKSDEVPDIDVKIEKINPSVEIIGADRFRLHRTGEERTILRFILDAQGGIISTNKLPKEIAQPRLIQRYRDSVDPRYNQYRQGANDD